MNNKSTDRTRKWRRNMVIAGRRGIVVYLDTEDYAYVRATAATLKVSMSALIAAIVTSHAAKD